MLDFWRRDNKSFVSTKACREVESKIESKNLVVVTGTPGSGKSAIIQHIALEYINQGWTVKPVRRVEEIVNAFATEKRTKERTLFVFDDPIGKESLDEKLHYSWLIYEELLSNILEKYKVLISCRIHILNNNRVKGHLNDESNVVNICDDHYKFTDDDKQHILKTCTTDINLSEEDCASIIQSERFSPLLCKLCFRGDIFQKYGLGFFEDPVEVLKKEIKEYRETDNNKYYALMILVLSNNNLCCSDLLNNEIFEKKYLRFLELCKIDKCTSTCFINSLDSLTDSFVRKVGDAYRFYHDFLMDVSSLVFGTDHPAIVIQCADLDFLRRRVKLDNFSEDNDSLTIYLKSQNIDELGNRLFTNILEESNIDVFFNDFLKNKAVIETLKKEIKHRPNKLHMLLKKKKNQNKTLEIDRIPPRLFLSKLFFVNLENDVTPLFVIIALCHTDLSIYCLNMIQQRQIDIKGISLFSAVCCNGSVDLFYRLYKDNHSDKSLLTEKWGNLYPIHIASVFHSYDLLLELITFYDDIDVMTDDKSGWTPLTLAVANDCGENENCNSKQSSDMLRNKIVQLLLNNGAKIDFCRKDGASSLYIACERGHSSTVQLLLSKKADINLCNKNGFSPLYIACLKGHDDIMNLLISEGADFNIRAKNGSSILHIACEMGLPHIVEILLKHVADVNLCDEDGKSPLYIASKKGKESTVNLLLKKGADINMCKKNGASPLYSASKYGHVNTVQLLLSKKANINSCNENGFSPLFIACLKGHDDVINLLISEGADLIASMEGNESTARLLLQNEAGVDISPQIGTSLLCTACKNGLDLIVEYLLKKRVDANSCDKEGESPLYIASTNENESTVKLLLENNADVNMCKKNGASPLYSASKNGHEKIARLLLSYGADVNVCKKDGIGPLFIACQNGMSHTVKTLLAYRPKINAREKKGATPLFIASQNGHDCIVRLLIKNKADINLCKINGTSPLYIACQNNLKSTVKLLLENGANINQCKNNGYSPLSIVREKKYYSIEQLFKTDF